MLSVPREAHGLERPVVRHMTSVACGADQEGAPQSVATQTLREFAIESSPSSQMDPAGVDAEEQVPMEAGGSSVEAVVGGCVVPGALSAGDESSTSDGGSSSVDNAVVSARRLVGSGKLNSFKDHVIHCNFNMLMLSGY